MEQRKIKGRFSGSTLKIIAVVTMLIDHTAEVFGWEGWDLLSLDSDILRYIGRFSFPIFAFCLVEGWKHTRRKEDYFSRILIFACISQVPFSMALYPTNISAAYAGENAFHFHISTVFIPVAIIAIVSYWYFGLERKRSSSLLAVVFAAFLPVISLKVNYIWLLTPDSLNVLYTFALGLFVLFVIDKIKERELCVVEYLLLVVVAVLLLLAYGTNADYGYGLMGIALITVLYLTKESIFLQGGLVAIWGVIFYGLSFENWGNAFATFAPVILILLYNHERGYKGTFSKWVFYVFYPFHLLIIGLMNMYLK